MANSTYLQKEKMSFCYHFTIFGNPAIKKNSRTVVRNSRTGRMFPIKSRKLEIAEWDAYVDLMNNKHASMKLPIRTPVNVCFTFYRGTRHRVDLSNLYGLPEDALQKAGVLENDSLIESHDGSRKRYDPKNPRTEITITPFVD